jgi:hypothetical protein
MGILTQSTVKESPKANLVERRLRHARDAQVRPRKQRQPNVHYLLSITHLASLSALLFTLPQASSLKQTNEAGQQSKDAPSSVGCAITTGILTQTDK